MPEKPGAFRRRLWRQGKPPVLFFPWEDSGASPPFYAGFVPVFGSLYLWEFELFLVLFYTSKVMQNFTDVPLKEVAKILRGVVTKPQEIKERTAPEDSGIFFLTVSDIQENYLSHSMKCLKNIEAREEKHCLMENDIVIAKMGQPKTGLARDLGEKKIIVSQNLYILRFDFGRVNPVYARAFFESALGLARLEKAYVKATIPTLPVRNLENLLIPLPEPENISLSLEIQEGFAGKYLEVENSEQNYRLQAEEEKKKRLCLFSDFISGFFG